MANTYFHQLKENTYCVSNITVYMLHLVQSCMGDAREWDYILPPNNGNAKSKRYFHKNYVGNITETHCHKCNLINFSNIRVSRCVMTLPSDLEMLPDLANPVILQLDTAILVRCKSVVISRHRSEVSSL